MDFGTGKPTKLVWFERLIFVFCHYRRTQYLVQKICTLQPFPTATRENAEVFKGQVCMCTTEYIYIYISKYKNKKQYKRGWINTWRHRALEEDDQGMTNLKAISVAHHPGLAHMKEMTQ